MSKNEKYTYTACKTIVFHCQIWKFVTFLLPSSFWLLKFPIIILTRGASSKNYHIAQGVAFLPHILLVTCNAYARTSQRENDCNF